MNKILVLFIGMFLIGGAFAITLTQEVTVNILPGGIDLVVISPLNGNIYTDRGIKMNLTTVEEVDEVTYIDNSENRPRERSLCRNNCFGYGQERKRTKSFRDGSHNLTFFAYNENGFLKENVVFFVDSKNPRVGKVEPRRDFYEGMFYVEFDEENPKKLMINYGNSEIGFNQKEISISESCVLNRKYECLFDLDLDEYDRTTVEYEIVVEDIAGNSDTSRVNEIYVDFSPPVLNDLNLEINGRRVNFVFDINEENFDEITYTNSNNIIKKEVNFCSQLRNGICEIKKSFSKGEHNLIFTIKDKAGNKIQENVVFEI